MTIWSFVYSSMGRIMVLLVFKRVSLFFPQCVVVSAFRFFSVFLALYVVFCMCRVWYEEYSCR